MVFPFILCLFCLSLCFLRRSLLLLCTPLNFRLSPYHIYPHTDKGLTAVVSQAHEDGIVVRITHRVDYTVRQRLKLLGT